MRDTLQESELVEGLSQDHVKQLSAMAERQALDAGEYLFKIGEIADRLYVVLEGRVDMCFPLSIGGALKDVAVETKTPGQALGWSAVVRPYRFTLSARAAEPTTLAALSRSGLLELTERDHLLGMAFLRRVGEMTGRRLLKIQALWARELQRAVSGGLPMLAPEYPTP